MKSAYELAMERLAKSDPAKGKPLTAAQKARLAELDRVYQGKWAEREILLKKQLDEAYAEADRAALRLEADQNAHGLGWKGRLRLGRGGRDAQQQGSYK